MPGSFIHIAVSDKVREHLSGLADWPTNTTPPLPALPGHTPKELVDIMSMNPHYYSLGAIGPDLFFFLPDFRGGSSKFLVSIVHWLEKMYTKLDDFILEDWERYFGPGTENLEEAISRLTGDVSSVVKTVMGDLATILIVGVEDLATQSTDWFEKFSLGLDCGYDNQDFLWSDMLHYRKTSHFPAVLWGVAKEMENSADPSDANAKKWANRIRAYALGFMTHLGTDTTGHPFVNQKSGGPYRTHWQRHHLVENHMDAQTYADEHGMDALYSMLTESALHYRISFKDRNDPTGDDFPQATGTDPSQNRPAYDPSDRTLHGLYIRRRHLDLDSAMAPDLAQAIVDAMSKAYYTSPPPSFTTPSFAWTSTPMIIPGDGRPSPQTVQDTYQLLFTYLKMATLDGFHHEKPKVPQLLPGISLTDRFSFPHLTDPHDDPPNEGDTDMSVWDILLAIIRFILWLIAVAVWIATILPAILTDLLTFLPRLLAYYCIELPLYYMLEAERRVLVMTGYMLPMADEIDRGLVNICTGRRDSFLDVLKDMDDALANLEDSVLALANGDVLRAMNDLGLAAQDAVTKVLADRSSANTVPSEPSPDAHFPHQHPSDEYRHPWDYPTTNVELDPTVAGPFVCGDLPHRLLETGMPGSQLMRMRFESSPSPDVTHQVARGVTATDNLGDPVNFSSYLIWQLTRTYFPSGLDATRITDWNLDADRGYAYKCWDWNRYAAPAQGQPHDRGHHVWPDADGHDFMEPCTWPPQAKDHNVSLYDPMQALKLHYTDQPDPDCGSGVPSGSA